jgi:hypothetical protein
VGSPPGSAADVAETRLDVVVVAVDFGDCPKPTSGLERVPNAVIEISKHVPLTKMMVFDRLRVLRCWQHHRNCRSEIAPVCQGTCSHDATFSEDVVSRRRLANLQPDTFDRRPAFECSIAVGKNRQSLRVLVQIVRNLERRSSGLVPTESVVGQADNFVRSGNCRRFFRNRSSDPLGLVESFTIQCLASLREPLCQPGTTLCTKCITELCRDFRIQFADFPACTRFGRSTRRSPPSRVTNGAFVDPLFGGPGLDLDTLAFLVGLTIGFRLRTTPSLDVHRTPIGFSEGWTVFLEAVITSACATSTFIATAATIVSPAVGAATAVSASTSRSSRSAATRTAITAATARPIVATRR